MYTNSVWQFPLSVEDKWSRNSIVKGARQWWSRDPKQLCCSILSVESWTWKYCRWAACPFASWLELHLGQHVWVSSAFSLFLYLYISTRFHAKRNHYIHTKVFLSCWISRKQQKINQITIISSDVLGAQCQLPGGLEALRTIGSKNSQRGFF